MAQLNNLLVLGNTSLIGDVNLSSNLTIAGLIEGKIKSTLISSNGTKYLLFSETTSGGVNLKLHEDVYYYYGGTYSSLNVGKTTANGILTLWKSGLKTDIKSSATAARTITLPDKDGTLAMQTTWNNFIHSGNEFTFASPAYSGSIWFNYRTASGGTNGNITGYIFGNGKGGQAGVTVEAATFKGAFTGDVNGNATSASTLKSSGSLNSTSVDTVLTSAASLQLHTGDNTIYNSNDGLILTASWSSSYGAQIWLDDGSGEGGMAIRNRTSTSWNPWRQILSSYNYDSYALPLSGGTMTGDIILPKNKGIIQHQNSYSNYTVPIKWLQGGVSEAAYDPQIGHHNTGDTDGAIILLPYSTNTSPWNGSDGLYIGKNSLKWNGYSVLTSKSTITVAQGGTGRTTYATTDYTGNQYRASKIQNTIPTSIDNGCIVYVYSDTTTL